MYLVQPDDWPEGPGSPLTAPVELIFGLLAAGA